MNPIMRAAFDAAPLHDADNPDDSIAQAFKELRWHCAAVEAVLRDCEREDAVEQLVEMLQGFASSSLAEIPNVHLPRLLTGLISIVAVESWNAFCEWDDAIEGKASEWDYQAHEAEAEAGDERAQFEVTLYDDYRLLHMVLVDARDNNAMERLIRATLGQSEVAPPGSLQ